MHQLWVKVPLAIYYKDPNLLLPFPWLSNPFGAYGLFIALKKGFNIAKEADFMIMLKDLGLLTRKQDQIKIINKFRSLEKPYKQCPFDGDFITNDLFKKTFKDIIDLLSNLDVDNKLLSDLITQLSTDLSPERIQELISSYNDEINSLCHSFFNFNTSGSQEDKETLKYNIESALRAFSTIDHNEERIEESKEKGIIQKTINHINDLRHYDYRVMLFEDLLQCILFFLIASLTYEDVRSSVF